MALPAITLPPFLAGAREGSCHMSLYKPFPASSYKELRILKSGPYWISSSDLFFPACRPGIFRLRQVSGLLLVFNIPFTVPVPLLRDYCQVPLFWAYGLGLPSVALRYLGFHTLQVPRPTILSYGRWDYEGLRTLEPAFS